MANDGENKSRKRKQQYRPNNRPVKKKGAYPLRPGVEGFFITCDGGRDHQASIEAINIIDSFFDELVNGKDVNPGARQQAPPKALNKKIKFNFSDSSESEGEEGDEGGKAKKSEVGEEKSEIGDGVKAKTEGNGAKVEEEKPQRVDGVEAKTEDDDGKVEQESEAAGEMESDSGADAEAKTEDNDVKVEPDNSEKEDKEPPVKKQCTGSNGAESGTHAPFQGKTELSIDQQIEAELAQLTDKNKRRFLKLDSGCNGVVFIQMRTKDGEPGPKEVAQRMMETAFSTRKHMARHIMRVLPVEVACYSSEEEISRAIKPLVHKYFSVETETPTKFAVLYDARANSGIDRMKIINAVAKSVPPPHKVDLNNPDKSIVVQIVKTVCLIGVVENFKKFAKYNLRQLTS